MAQAEAAQKAPSRCIVCGEAECDRRHPEIPAWSEGWQAVEDVLRRLEARKRGSGSQGSESKAA